MEKITYMIIYKCYMEKIEVIPIILMEHNLLCGMAMIFHVDIHVLMM